MTKPSKNFDVVNLLTLNSADISNASAETPLIAQGDGTLSLGGNVTTRSITLTQDPGFVLEPGADCEVHCDSGGTIDERGFNFQFVDDGGTLNKISWARDTGDELALNVWDIDAQQNLFEVEDTGTARLPTGSLEYSGGENGPAISTAENLAGKTGNHDGEIRMDDGTNTPARMTPCVWDNVNSVWRPTHAPDTGSFS